MAYIGKSPSGTGVRSRFFYTQSSAGATSISGNDDDNRTLTFSDAEYVDVYLNGSLLAKGDYTAASNTISGLAALASGDIVEVVVYDIFTVADTVSAKDGGTFSGNVGMQGLTATTGDFTGQLHVQTSAVNSSIDNVADEFVIENNGASGMTILSANNDSGFILFGDDSDNAAGGIRYENATSAMSFRVNSGWDKLRIDSAGRVIMPQQPSFLASQTTTLQNSATTVTYGQDFDIGNNYNPSNGRFTAPCSGVFFFVCSIQAHKLHTKPTSTVFLKTVSSTAPASLKTWAGVQTNDNSRRIGDADVSGDYATVCAQRGHRGIQGAFTGFLIG